MRLNQKVGIIDVGSNSMRLVIYKKDKGLRYKELENIKTVARLRNYLNEDKVLDDEGINKLIETLKSFQQITQYHRLEQIKCVATATIRQAVNQDIIVQKVKESTDFDMIVLSEYEESFYGYLAVVNSTPIEHGITIDIGGGSTEVTLFKNRQLLKYHSFPFGIISLKKQFIKGEVPTQEELDQLRNYLSEQFTSLPWLSEQINIPIIGIGGSARNVVQIDQSMKNYPLAGLHQYELKREDLGLVKQFLIPLSFTELQRVEGLSKDRADVILPALEVFDVLLQICHASCFILSKKGLREGVFYEELMKPYATPIFPDVVEESFHDLALDFEINHDQVTHLNKTVTFLYKELIQQKCELLNDEDLFYLKKAAYVFNIGEYIDSESSSQHTFYLLTNRTIDGLMHRERLLIALLASYKSKESFKQFITPFTNWFSKDEQRKLRLLGTLLKFSHSLNGTKRGIVKRIEINHDGLITVIHLYCDQDWKSEQYQAEKQKRPLEKILKRTVILQFHKLV
ncbi:exopolyphosphatase [Bacillus sp. DJP31]|uniref:Ppx/GppA phosphatase family protein n=1 Tax=Bacillus sp. DJP31 TaxID=3409789 RepID=UPI003BB55680